MIFKKIPKPKNIQGSTQGLAKYLTTEASVTLSSVSSIENYLISPKGNEVPTERVGKITWNNVPADSLDQAVEIIQNTQLFYAQLSGNKKDQNYHFVMSFPEGERPSDDLLEKMEKDVVAALGFEDHQRFSVQHIDTNNFHVHITVNSVNPETLKVCNPSHDYRIFAKEAESNEETYNLIRTNHGKKIGKDRPHPIDLKQADQSFLDYLRNEVGLGDFQKLNVKNWKGFHEHLDKHGVGIKAKGNGLVLYDLGQMNVHVKLSSVNRSLSLKKLEKIFNESFSAKPLDDDKKKNVVNVTNYKPEKIRSASFIMSKVYEEYKTYKKVNDEKLKKYNNQVKKDKQALFDRYKREKGGNKRNAYHRLQMGLYTLTAKLRPQPKTISFQEYLKNTVANKHFMKKLTAEEQANFIKEVDDKIYTKEIVGKVFTKDIDGKYKGIPTENHEKYGKLQYFNNYDVIRKKDNKYFVNQNLSAVGINKLYEIVSKDFKNGKLIDLVGCNQKDLSGLCKLAISNNQPLRFSNHENNLLYEKIAKEVKENERKHRRIEFGRLNKRSRFRKRKQQQQYSNGRGDSGLDKFRKFIGFQRIDEWSSALDKFGGRLGVDGIELTGRTANEHVVVKGDRNGEGWNYLSNIANINDRLLHVSCIAMAFNRVEGSESKRSEELLQNDESNRLGLEQSRSQGDRNVRREDDGRTDNGRTTDDVKVTKTIEKTKKKPRRRM